jgi:predicted anti-sigma-YlaC factor YlaD
MRMAATRNGRNLMGRSQLALWLMFLFGLVAGSSGCSVRKMAVNKIGDALASGGDTFASDEDVQLVGSALPFSLKLMESLLAESPKHRGLLFAASSGFTQYSYVFVQQDAEEMEDHDLGQAAAMKARARRLYLRARDYGLRGLETKHPGFGAALRHDATTAVRAAKVKDVPLLYWTAASWGSAISLSKDNPDLVADQLIVEALIDRAAELQSDYDHGSIHAFLITYESARQGVRGEWAARSRDHFAQAVRYSGGELAGPYVSLAETVSVNKQDRAEFESLLHRALAIDPDKRPEWRLANLVMQRRARWLLSRTDELFVK